MKLALSILLFIPLSLLSQQVKSQQENLSFLVGKWNVERTYSPNSEPRKLKGNLTCEWALDSTFISCRYKMERPQQKRGLDQVFFNYNPIYDKYESLWLSSTWPIKVLMQGEMEGHSFVYDAMFPIQEGLIEYVKSEWTVQLNQETPSFSRKTHIRTSQDPTNEWFHHMDETAILIHKSH
ncbi:MAG: DUF1579 family protein [Cytophagales bacterium]|nr:DUF1579 family protein [Cytophagales bacterium]